MGEISIPRSLSNADASLNLADSLAKLLDPVERKKIADDIKAHQALNESEAKKAEDARSLIKQHQDILNETRLIAEQNKKEASDLCKKQIDFKAECDSESQAIKDKWLEVNSANEAASKLHSNAQQVITDYGKKQENLNEEKLNIKKTLDQLEVDKEKLRKNLEDVEDMKKQQTVILDDLKAKKTAMAAFNI